MLLTFVEVSKNLQESLTGGSSAVMQLTAYLGLNTDLGKALS